MRREGAAVGREEEVMGREEAVMGREAKNCYFYTDYP